VRTSSASRGVQFSGVASLFVLLFGGFSDAAAACWQPGWGIALYAPWPGPSRQRGPSPPSWAVVAIFAIRLGRRQSGLTAGFVAALALFESHDPVDVGVPALFHGLAGVLLYANRWGLGLAGLAAAGCR